MDASFLFYIHRVSSILLGVQGTVKTQLLMSDFEEIPPVMTRRLIYRSRLLSRSCWFRFAHLSTMNIEVILPWKVGKVLPGYMQSDPTRLYSS